MAEMRDFNLRRPWLRTSFDLEGIVGALAAILFGVLLSIIWWPLFLLGLIGALIVLFATRRVSRSMPEHEFGVLAPVDGVVASVAKASPPTELRLGMNELTRIRIASSPVSPNPVYAPVTGQVTASVSEVGDPSVPFASSAEAHGLAIAYVALGDGGRDFGLRIASGGLGPRLDIDLEPGDMLRAGRKLGQRRLGGWVDVYLPDGMEAMVWPGMTVVAIETELGRVLSDGWVVKPPAIEDEEDERTELDLEDLGTPDETSAALFEKLRKEAQGVED